jgi:hypothetical protein
MMSPSAATESVLSRRRRHILAFERNRTRSAPRFEVDGIDAGSGAEFELLAENTTDSSRSYLKSPLSGNEHRIKEPFPVTAAIHKPPLVAAKVDFSNCLLNGEPAEVSGEPPESAVDPRHVAKFTNMTATTAPVFPF